MLRLADSDRVVAYSHPHLAHSRRGHLWRLPLAAAVVTVVIGIDSASKAAALIAGHGAMDAPSSSVRPVGTILVGLMALAGIALLPALCLPGALLVMAGSGSNILSLALWPGVPNPLGVHIAGGILHFNLADVCVVGGGALFLAAALWTIWRMPADEFARLFAR